LFKFAASTVLSLFLCASLAGTSGQASSSTPAATFDVIHYDAQVEPDIVNKTVAGRVSIKFISRVPNLADIELDCGDLVIDAVRAGGEAQKFARLERRVRVALGHPAKAGESREIEFDYHGAPRRGIRFLPERNQVYTVFTTSQWMVCVDAPDDKATLHLVLILPANLSNVANGRLVAQRALPNKKTAYEWRQEQPVSTYTFGFAAGPFHTLTQQHGHVQLRYLATEFSEDELRRIFRDTADMIDFYEDRADVQYAGRGLHTSVSGGRRRTGDEQLHRHT
jgi:aminopeptidase N